MPRYRIEILLDSRWKLMLETDDYRTASAGAMYLWRVAGPNILSPTRSCSIRIVDGDHEARELEPVVFQITQGLR